MSGRLFLATSLVLFTLSTAASAAEPRVTVELKNGSSLRGELVERAPGRKIVLMLATGEARTIEWSDIARIEEPSAAVSSQTSSGATEGIAVHVSTDDPRTTLQRRAGTSTVYVQTSRGAAVGEGEAWEDVCVAPCDSRVAKNQTLRIAGDGVTPSSNFVLQRDVRLDVKTGSSGLRVGGVWLLTLGLTTAILGGTFLALDARRSNYDGNGKFTEGEPIIPPAVTYGLIGGGLLAIGGGIAMLLGSGTTVRDETGTTIGKAQTPFRFSF